MTEPVAAQTTEGPGWGNICNECFGCKIDFPGIRRCQCERQASMTDDEFLGFLGFTPGDFTGPEHRARVLEKLADKRPTYERMYTLTQELPLYEAGLAPRPAGVLLDFDRKGNRRDR